MDDINNKIKVDMVSVDDMTAEERSAILDKKPSIEAIPDIDVLTGNVLEILRYLENPETKRLMTINESAIKMYLNNKYADSVPYGIISLLMDEENRFENVERMVRMFESLNNAKNGKISLENAEKNLADEVTERYIYSKYGSKEAFDRELAKELKNSKTN